MEIIFHKFHSKELLVVIMLVGFSMLVSALTNTSAKADDMDQTVETVATYNYNDVSPDEMEKIKEIVSSDNTVNMKINID